MMEDYPLRCQHWTPDHLSDDGTIFSLYFAKMQASALYCADSTAEGGVSHQVSAGHSVTSGIWNSGSGVLPSVCCGRNVQLGGGGVQSNLLKYFGFSEHVSKRVSKRVSVPVECFAQFKTISGEIRILSIRTVVEVRG